MRFIAKLALCLCLSAPGCGRTGEAPAESPEQAAARILEVAQTLEKEHKTKQAFAAYHQIVRHYPATAGGQKAAQRIDQEQKAVMKRRVQ
jgi:hypothetical protein